MTLTEAERERLQQLSESGGLPFRGSDSPLCKCGLAEPAPAPDGMRTFYARITPAGIAALKEAGDG